MRKRKKIIGLVLLTVIVWFFVVYRLLGYLSLEKNQSSVNSESILSSKDSSPPKKQQMILDTSSLQIRDPFFEGISIVNKKANFVKQREDVVQNTDILMNDRTVDYQVDYIGFIGNSKGNIYSFLVDGKRYLMYVGEKKSGIKLLSANTNAIKVRIDTRVLVVRRKK